MFIADFYASVVISHTDLSNRDANVISIDDWIGMLVTIGYMVSHSLLALRTIPISNRGLMGLFGCYYCLHVPNKFTTVNSICTFAHLRTIVTDFFCQKMHITRKDTMSNPFGSCERGTFLKHRMSLSIVHYIELIVVSHSLLALRTIPSLFPSDKIRMDLTSYLCV